MQTFTYEQLSREAIELNDCMAEASYLADRARGTAETDDFCPVRSVVLADSADRATYGFVVQLTSLQWAVAMHNEHAGLLTIGLVWDSYDGRWELL